MTRRWLLLLALLAAAFVAAAAVVAMDVDHEPRFCTADGVIGPDGTVYGRSAKHDCKFVDEDGNVLLFDEDGNVLPGQ